MTDTTPREGMTRRTAVGGMLGSAAMAVTAPAFARAPTPGRKPNSEGFGFADVGIEMDRAAVAVDDFYRTMAFVNAVAWIANTEDHHPDLEVGYATCVVRYSTHSVGGLSRNDFICAAKIDHLGPPASG